MERLCLILTNMKSLEKKSNFKPFADIISEKWKKDFLIDRGGKVGCPLGPAPPSLKPVKKRVGAQCCTPKFALYFFIFSIQPLDLGINCIH